MNAYKAVFLDKDGTLVADKPYNDDPDEMALASDVERGLPALYSAGFRLVVISNQAGVARGYLTEKSVVRCGLKLRSLFAEVGAQLDGFYYCPHDPEGKVKAYAVPCTCRKPQAGLIWRAAEELGLDPGQSWFIGDILDDVEAGKRAGCRTVFLDVGHETEWVDSPFRRPDFTVNDFREATEKILREEIHQVKK